MDYSASVDSFIHNVGIFVLLLLFIIAFVRRSNKQRPDPADASSHARFVRWFSMEDEKLPGSQPKLADIGSRAASAAAADGGFWVSAAALSACAVGLQVSYLTWGVLQERLITLDFEGEKFESSLFLVFTNRAVAFCVALAIHFKIKGSGNRAPFYKYSFASFSNILSSWCQYEALKYVSFPTQVVSKSSKLIPVMVVGKILANKTYQLYEYGVALVISIGVIVFTLAQEGAKAKISADGGEEGASTAVGGVVLLLGYITFDSFTSQWQGLLFKTHKISPYQMMLGVNAFSASFTLISLVLSQEIFAALSFISSHPSCAGHIALLSVCGATGQLFIFYTIKRFGPLVFTMIMTTRQLISIVLSCFIYSHPIQPRGYVGAMIVFSALAFRIKARHDASKPKRSAPEEVRTQALNSKQVTKAKVAGRG